uniref:B3 domain-containing transcription factor VRN1-like n=1 Tax=Fragaria vesca subsp. vesca TaxID=101020 RepID=UPI0005C8EBF4|nr:PREDICTED: B3 domain-containing transcription factor VRN1-like [Fragaria vesca subsp. vesca]
MATKINPSFIKALQGDQFSVKLKLPSAFLQCLNGRLPPQCSLQTQGRTWNVSVEKVNHKFYFQLGWNGFVQDNGLKCGEILVFHYAGNSQFHVEIFGINTCKKLHVMPEMEEANEHDVSPEILDDLPPCPRKAEEKSFLSSPLPHKRSKASSSGKADITLNFLKRLPRLEKSAMKKKDSHRSESKMISIFDNDSGDEDHHDEKEYEDDDHDEECDAENEDDEEEATEDQEKEEDDDSIETLSDSPGCSRTVRKYTLASSLHQRKRKRYTVKAKTKIKAVGVLSSEEKILKAIAIQRACTFKFNSDNPCFVISMSISYASGKFLNVPRSFAAEHLTNLQPGHIILKVNKRFWSVKVNYLGTTTKLQAGWSKFVHDNNLKFGYVCVFVLTNAIEFEYVVEIFRVTDAV